MGRIEPAPSSALVTIRCQVAATVAIVWHGIHPIVKLESVALGLLIRKPNVSLRVAEDNDHLISLLSFF